MILAAHDAATLESIAIGALNVLESMRVLDLPARLYHAGSGECFGDIDGMACETTAFAPRSPYAVAKASAHWAVAHYRDAYGLHASTGILFNHESPLRPERFVTRKVVRAAVRIAAGQRERLRLGTLDIARDWGWAPEYVDAMWRMLEQPMPDDYVIATGIATPLAEFVARTLAISTATIRTVGCGQGVGRLMRLSKPSSRPMSRWQIQPHRSSRGVLTRSISRVSG